MDFYMVKEVTHYCNLSGVKCTAMGPFKIDFYDLTFVTDGTMTYTVKDTTYLLKKNDAIFLPPGTVRTRVQGIRPAGYVSFNFHLLPDCTLPFSHHLPGCMSSEIKKLISAFPQSHLLHYYHAKEKLTSMLNYILFELQDITAFPSGNEHVIKMVKYINSHITEKLSLSVISREVALSKEYAANIFKREMHKTVTEYINEKKMQAAKELIASHELTLADVATQLGFENYNYFSRLFRKYFDVTPIAFKNKE